MAMNKTKAYNAYEKTENVLIKKKELKKDEGKIEKAKEVKKGIKLLKSNPMMKTSSMKKMGKKK